MVFLIRRSVRDLGNVPGFDCEANWRFGTGRRAMVCIAGDHFGSAPNIKTIGEMAKDAKMEAHERRP